MTFQWHHVAPPLGEFINFFYTARGSMPFSRDGIFPTASTDLKFNFGEPWSVRDYSGAPISTCTESWCLGIWNQRHFVQWPARTEFVGVSFKPGGAYAFLGVPLSHLHNCVVPLQAMWGSSAADIRERLYQAGTAEQRFALLEQVLLARLQDRSQDMQVVDHMVTRIVGRRGQTRIGELCEEVGRSHKHIIALFNRVVGCPPKQLARLCRFQHTLQRIDVSKPIRLTTLAHDSNYFDQSHFNREFEAFSGLSPTAYIRQRQVVHAEQPGHASVSWMLPAG